MEKEQIPFLFAVLILVFVAVSLVADLLTPEGLEIGQISGGVVGGGGAGVSPCPYKKCEAKNPVGCDCAGIVLNYAGYCCDDMGASSIQSTCQAMGDQCRGATTITSTPSRSCEAQGGGCRWFCVEGETKIVGDSLDCPWYLPTCCKLSSTTTTRLGTTTKPSVTTTLPSGKCCCSSLSGIGCISKASCLSGGQGYCIGNCPCPATTTTWPSPTTTKPLPACSRECVGIGYRGGGTCRTTNFCYPGETSIDQDRCSSGQLCCCFGSLGTTTTVNPSSTCNGACQSFGVLNGGTCRTGNVCYYAETTIGPDGCGSGSLCCCFGSPYRPTTTTKPPTTTTGYCIPDYYYCGGIGSRCCSDLCDLNYYYCVPNQITTTTTRPTTTTTRLGATTTTSLYPSTIFCCRDTSYNFVGCMYVNSCAEYGYTYLGGPYSTGAECRTYCK